MGGMQRMPPGSISLPAACAGPFQFPRNQRRGGRIGRCIPYPSVIHVCLRDCAVHRRRLSMNWGMMMHPRTRALRFSPAPGAASAPRVACYLEEESASLRRGAARATCSPAVQFFSKEFP